MGVRPAPSPELTGLRRRYGWVVELDDLSFTVPPGQVFGFLGPNGADKPTTMRPNSVLDEALTEFQQRLNGDHPEGPV